MREKALWTGEEERPPLAGRATPPAQYPRAPPPRPPAAQTLTAVSPLKSAPQQGKHRFGPLHAQSRALVCSSYLTTAVKKSPSPTAALPPACAKRWRRALSPLPPPSFTTIRAPLAPAAATAAEATARAVYRNYYRTTSTEALGRGSSIRPTTPCRMPVDAGGQEPDRNQNKQSCAPSTIAYRPKSSSGWVRARLGRLLAPLQRLNQLDAG